MVNNPIVVMYPDYRGESTRNGFPNQIRAHLPSASIVPVFNGTTVSNLDSLVAEAPSLGLDGVRSEQPGLAPALMKGYGRCLERYAGHTVVRLDTAEHDVSYLSPLVKKAAETRGLVVGDLSFGSGTLKKGSLDELMHLELFPRLYNQFAGIPLSCAHGYHAISPEVLDKVYEGTLRIMKEVENNSQEKPTWGFDGAMVLSAVKQHVPVNVIHIPAKTVRDRPVDKIVEQYTRALHVCAAAEQVFK